MLVPPVGCREVPRGRSIVLPAGAWLRRYVTTDKTGYLLGLRYAVVRTV